MKQGTEPFLVLNKTISSRSIGLKEMIAFMVKVSGSDPKATSAYTLKNAGLSNMDKPKCWVKNVM